MSDSKRIHRTRSGDTKGQKLARGFLAFALFLAIAGLGLSGCVRLGFVKAENVANIFTNEKYTEALYNDVYERSEDLLQSCMLPSDCLKEALSVKAIEEITEAYAYGALSVTPDYTNTTYLDIIDDLSKELESSVNNIIKVENLEVDKNQKDGAKVLADNICEYIKSRVEFRYMEKLASVVSIGETASLVLMIVSAFFAVILAVIVPSIGEKRYRAMRSLVHSITAAGLLELILVAGVEVVKAYKKLILYPFYFRDSILRYVGECEIYVVFSAICLFVLALIIATIIWKINRDANN